MEALSFKIVKTSTHDEVIARGSNYEICKAAFEKAIFVYPNDHLEMRQGARVICKSNDRTSKRVRARTPIGTPSRSIGTASEVRKPPNLCASIKVSSGSASTSGT